MKLVKSYLMYVFFFVYSAFSTLTVGAEVNRAWMTSACYQFRLAVWDKFGGAAEPAKFIITSNNGRKFISERSATGDPNTSEVVFPDDFVEAKSNRKAAVNCFNGETYTWEMYVNNEVKDSGTIGFARNNKSPTRRSSGTPQKRVAP